MGTGRGLPGSSSRFWTIGTCCDSSSKISLISVADKAGELPRRAGKTPRGGRRQDPGDGHGGRRHRRSGGTRRREAAGLDPRRGQGRGPTTPPIRGGQRPADPHQDHRAGLGDRVDGDHQAVDLVVDPGEGVEGVRVAAAAAVAEGQGPEPVVGAGRVVGDGGDRPRKVPLIGSKALIGRSPCCRPAGRRRTGRTRSGRGPPPRGPGAARRAVGEVADQGAVRSKTATAPPLIAAPVRGLL